MPYPIFYKDRASHHERSQQQELLLQDQEQDQDQGRQSHAQPPVPLPEVVADEESNCGAPWQQKQRRRPPVLPVLLILTLLALALHPVCHRRLPQVTAVAPHVHEVQEVSDGSYQDGSDDDDSRPLSRPRGLLSRVRDRAVDAAAAAHLAVVRRRQFPIPIPIPIPAAPSTRRGVLECVQVAQPVMRPSAAAADADADDVDDQAEPVTEEACEVVLMEHVFAASYGVPFVGYYTPPGCTFNRVTMNFTVVSAGRQYDRLAIMYMNDTEVWRTSTAEPVVTPGIRWEYHKDMTAYLSFWKTQQKIIFDLGNLVSDVYNGTFNATLTATFFQSDAPSSTAQPADLIIPISLLRGSQESSPTSVFVVPENDAETVVSSFPRNANRAVLSISANGQGAEEFWWSNLLDSDTTAFSSTAGVAGGFSPFREVRAFIDGRLAGVQWPFPVIFTGGVVPGLHRPIVGLQAFDLREHEIDITPWLPVLCDGKPHTFTFVMTGLNDNNATRVQLSNGVNASWYITGKVFVWLDDEGSITTGSIPELRGLDPSIKVSHRTFQDQLGVNRSLTYSVEVHRDFTVRSTVVTQRKTIASSWNQRLSYVTGSNLTSYGLDQISNFNVTGSDTAAANDTATYGLDYHYPLAVNQQMRTDAAGALSLRASLYQGLVLQVAGAAVYPDGLDAFRGRTGFKASIVSTFRNGVATYQRSADQKSTLSTSQMLQEFAFGGNFERYPDLSAGSAKGSQPDVMLYYRNISETNDAVVSDRESIADDSADDGAASASDVVDAAMGASSSSAFGPATSQVIMSSLQGVAAADAGEFAPETTAPVAGEGGKLGAGFAARFALLRGRHVSQDT